MTTDTRLAELESRLAFQDDTVNSLNAIVAAQQLDIDRLKLQVKELASALRSVRDEYSSAGGGSLEDERPPHY